MKFIRNLCQWFSILDISLAEIGIGCITGLDNYMLNDLFVDLRIVLRKVPAQNCRTEIGKIGDSKYHQGKERSY